MAKDKFEPTMYVSAYELARDGLTDTEIAGTFGVSMLTLRRWCDKRPALADALARGRHFRDPGHELSFREYVYDHLSPELRGLWDEINACETLENGVERVSALLHRHGVRTRQHLFIYALTQTMFNISRALRKVGVARKQFEDWCANDPEFHELIDEIHWHKQNFFEQSFIGRCMAGDTHAIIHAVKTKCRDRGYNEKIEIEHSGAVQMQHVVSITELDLDIETQRAVLAALRHKQEVEERTLDAQHYTTQPLAIGAG